MSVADRDVRTTAGATRLGVTGGAGALAREAQALRDVYAATPGLGITGSWPWVAASLLDPAPNERPWAVTVGDGDELTGAVSLVDVTGGAVRRTTLAGTAEHHRGAFAARDAVAADALGTALADALLDDLREFVLGPVAPGPVVDALLRRLPVPVLVEEVAVPVVRFGGDLPTGMSHGTERTLRKARNRLAADGVEAQFDSVCAAGTILAMLPALESISRQRDVAAGRPSPLDDPTRRRLWERRVRAVAATGRLRLETLHLDGELAAYVLGVDDDGAYRVLEGRYVGHWARYAPGRLLEAAVLEAAAARSGCRILDWMTDIAPETLLAANDADWLLVIRGRS